MEITNGYKKKDVKEPLITFSISNMKYEFSVMHLHHRKNDWFGSQKDI